jgi:hypothetical protein
VTARTLAGFGLSARLPAGWEGRVYRRTVAPPETAHPVLHAATFALPPQRGDFGAGAVELMGPDDVFVALLEYHPDSASSALFASAGLPIPLDVARFGPTSLQRVIAGQCGAQWFFTAAGRACCLYVVLGSWAGRYPLVDRANQLVVSLAVEAFG